MGYRTYGLTSLREFLDQNVVYRNLVPADDRLPSFGDLRDELGLSGRVPRKAEPAYGCVVAAMLRRARALDGTGARVARVLYMGDTELNDGTAFRNICAAGQWPGWCFIGRDTLAQPPAHRVEGALYVANRWAALPAFLAYVAGEGFALDQGTAVVIDLDKTAIGARGRNDGVIDQARVEGVQRTVGELLGPSFDQRAFRAAYDELNQSAYYGLTADNQDYLAYICLMLGAGVFELAAVVRAVGEGTLRCFDDLIAQAHERRAALAPSGLVAIHDDVWARVQAGDPTPFKAFRYNEYLATAARFGDLPGAGPQEVIQQRIAITQEVRAAALSLRARGALIFGLSDKPDEASVPSEAQAQAGMEPLHRLVTLALGQA
ncbi:MAG: hypothetical protein JXA09_18080 [Anaerolineae bacterium]|nr:hypothetical protein [Anaerolineae bacterium]